MRMQRHVVFLCVLGGGHAGQIIGPLAQREDVAQLRLVVLIAAVGGDQPDGRLFILLTQILNQLSGGEAGADNDDIG